MWGRRLAHEPVGLDMLVNNAAKQHVVDSVTEISGSVSASPSEDISDCDLRPACAAESGFSSGQVYGAVGRKAAQDWANNDPPLERTGGPKAYCWAVLSSGEGKIIVDIRRARVKPMLPAPARRAPNPRVDELGNSPLPPGE
jgi:hypothetical protein